MLNRTQYPSEVIALVVLWRLRYRLTRRDLGEMFVTALPLGSFARRYTGQITKAIKREALNAAVHVSAQSD